MKKIFITGNVGRDPKLRADQAGTQFATFSVGVSVGTKQSPKTDWVDISCNGKLADVARNYIKRGTKILVEGFPSVNAYVNKENKPVGTLRIFANNFELLSKKEDGQDNSDEPVYSLPESGTKASSSLSSDDLNAVPF